MDKRDTAKLPERLPLHCRWHCRLAFAFAATMSWGALGLVGSADASGSASRPNIVLILGDDMGLGDVAAYNPDPNANGAPAANHLQAATPNLDALASQGMRFTNAHAPAAVCTPTRYGLLTGRHAYRSIRGYGNGGNYGDIRLQEGDGRTMADVLHDAGYATAMVGKWHLGFEVYNAAGAPLSGSPQNQSIVPDWSKGLGEGPAERGFDYSFGHISSSGLPPFKYFQNDQWVSNQAVWTTGASEFNLDLMRQGWRDPFWDPRNVTRVLRNKAVDYIEEQAQNSEQPFFLYFPLSAPHTPTAPHADFQGTTAGLYTDFVAEVDDAVGAIMDAIEQQGIAENTLILFATDNGAFEDYSQRQANNPTHEAAGYLPDASGSVKELRGQKFDAYEGGHRVPFIAKWGDGTPVGSTIAPGVVSDEIVNLMDVYRTVAGLAGAPLAPTEGVDSYDILPILAGDGTDIGIREATFSASNGGAFAITARDDQGVEWKLIYAPGNGDGGQTIVNANQPSIQSQLANVQLFNLTNDVGESTNLLQAGGMSQAEISKVNELHQLMYGYLSSGHSVAQAVLGLYGDFNSDGTVDSADYTLWRNNLGTSFHLGGRGEENGASQGVVDMADYQLWKANYGASVAAFAASTASAVPEPGAFVYFVQLACVAGWSFSSRRRRKYSTHREPTTVRFLDRSWSGC